MNNIKKIISASMLIIFALAFSGCNMIEKTPEAKQKSAVAKVNGDKITRKELDENPQLASFFKQMEAQYGKDFAKNEQGKEVVKEQKDKALDQMIMERILIQKAEELKVAPKDDELNKKVDEEYNKLKKEQFKGDGKKLEEALKAQGITKEYYKEFTKKSIIIQKLVDKITKDVKVTEADIKKDYDANKSNYTEKPNTMDISHILVKTEDEAKKVKARLDKKEDFAKVAKEVSQDPGSKEKGGSLGTVQYNDQQLDPTFLNAAKALKEGQISAPVKTQFGYHIIKVTKKKEYPVKKYEKVKEDIKKKLEQNKKQEVYTKKLDEWKKASTIKKYDKNLMD